MEICFIDIETTGLDSFLHDLLEVGLLYSTDATQISGYTEWEVYNQQASLINADSTALRINRYWDRHRRIGDHKEWRDAQTIAQTLAIRTAGCVLAGANVHFDMHFLDVWMRRHGAPPAWDYHVLDVPTYAAAYINNQPGEPLQPPFRMNNDLLNRLNLPHPNQANRHTAIGDARLAKQVWDRVGFSSDQAHK